MLNICSTKREVGIFVNKNTIFKVSSAVGHLQEQFGICENTILL